MDQIHHQIGQTPMQGFEFCPVTWAPQQLDVFPSPGPATAAMSVQQKVVSFLAHPLLNHGGMINLVQFWAPFTYAGETVLSVCEQPFAAAGGQLCNGLLEYYRNECISSFRHPFGGGSDSVSLAFRDHIPQYAGLNLGWPTESSDFPICWALPLVEPAGCVGVLEFISLRDCFQSGSGLYEQLCTFFSTNGVFLENSGDTVQSEQCRNGNDNSYLETMDVINASEDQTVITHVDHQYNDPIGYDNYWDWDTMNVTNFLGNGNFTVNNVINSELRLPNERQILSIADHRIFAQETVENANQIFSNINADHHFEISNQIFSNVNADHHFENANVQKLHENIEQSTLEAASRPKATDKYLYTVKASYGDLNARFNISSSTTFKGLCKLLKKHFAQQKLGSFRIEYEDAVTNSRIKIRSTEDLKAFLKASKTLELFVISGNY